MKLTPFGVYRKYVALKLHFTSSRYNYIAMNGSTSCTEASYHKRNDKQFFEIIARKVPDEYQVEELFISAFLNNAYAWVGDVSSLSESLERCHIWKGYLSALTYTITRDIKFLKNYLDTKGLSFDDLFLYEVDMPLLYWFAEHKEIAFETAILFDIVFKFTQKAKPKDQKKNIIWDAWKLKMRKYSILCTGKSYITQKHIDHFISELKSTFLPI